MMGLKGDQTYPCKFYCIFNISAQFDFTYMKGATINGANN